MNKRMISLFAIICMGILSLFIMILYIGNGIATEAVNESHYSTVAIGTSRGKIYDRNLDLLVETTDRLVAAVTPSTAAIEMLSKSFGQETANEIVTTGKPFVTAVDEEIDNELIKTFPVSPRYDSSQLAVHLIGYLDSSGKNGLAGVEKAYNNILSENSGSLSVRFEVDAMGRVLPGLDKIIVDNNYRSNAGIALTIDSKIQSITEKALNESEIESGCALVMHVDTGEILAMDSVPRYDPNNISDSLNGKNSPFINKNLQSYSAGSVFKSIVAATALECGISSKTTFECKGSLEIGDTVFRCYDEKEHGKQTMSQALENSCNTYFIELIEKIDSDLLLSVCKTLGLGSELELCSGIACAAGSLPDERDLLLRGERANFSFGQGKLLLTPIQLLAAYNAIATGFYVEPTVFFGYVNHDKLVTKQIARQRFEVFSQSTVQKMRKLLSNVVEKGKAYSAKSSLISLAGKTGTAQSGIFDEQGVELCRTWFAGFFPANNPHYVVVVMDENGVSGNADCAPVFKAICENIVGVVE